jgi:Ca2+-transporting ATPase
MHTPPRRPDAKLIDSTMIQNIVVLGVLMAVGTLFLFNWEWREEGEASARTIAFATMAMFQVFNALNCRSRTRSIFKIGFFANKYLLVAILASFSLNILATTVPFFQTALGTVPLSLTEWIAVILVASSILLVDEVRKFVRPRITGYLVARARPS